MSNQPGSAALDPVPSPDPAAARLAELRQAVVAATRPPEAECLLPLIDAARPAVGQGPLIRELAVGLATEVRYRRRRAGGIDALMNEFALDSSEGVALMCLAEALLRIPDREGRLRLIRDKLLARDWFGHLGHSPSLFVNAAAWSLALTGRLLEPRDAARLPGILSRLASRGGELLVREAMDFAMRLVGHQFVLGETIEEALERASGGPWADYLYSFDMLGEAALTSEEAARYQSAYAAAIRLIGAADRGRGVLDGNGISIKLSALHPRYTWSQRGRVMAELVPRVRQLCLLARQYDIGLTIDAEESERLELSLDVLEALVRDPMLAGWDGLGFVVQAYQKRAPAVIDWMLALARQHRRRLMVRLVKGAYWDSEIKRAQQEGLSDYPVYTRKQHTDVAYLACARRLLAARDVVFPLFATHNAHTVAALIHGAGTFHHGDYEFQCLHGMGDSLFRQLVAADDPALKRPVRVYAPVGHHRSLLAYLVRRLLENGANSSFVNRIVDDRVAVSELVRDPVEAATASGGRPHPAIPLPADLYAGRSNSRGFDLASAAVRRAFAAALASSREVQLSAFPRVPGVEEGDSGQVLIRNPARPEEVVGRVRFALPEELETALQLATEVALEWGGTPAAERALCLERTAQALEARTHALVALLVREAGKTIAAGLGEVREAADFCRYYAARLRAGDLEGARPLGPVLAISPWNFPLAIFVGQIAAALAAGNPVLAKPAEQTPLVADQAVALFHTAGVPRRVLQCLPGPGETVGRQLVADARICGVMFTGSTQVARGIHQSLAARGGIPLVAETGGINAMIVDSTALPEQVVADVMVSAFDSAGQRCSALRLLCVQEEIAGRVLSLLDGALAELRLGPPDDFSTDVGPLIDRDARLRIQAYVDARRADRCPVLSRSLPDACGNGYFMAPTLVELASPEALRQEVFGPVLHVLRYAAQDLDDLLAVIQATGYGLTLGIQSRLDECVRRVVGQVRVGNIYVNRSMIGAVVGVQPFGGEGLSGTGPKAGGPLSLRRLADGVPCPLPELARPACPDLERLVEWLRGRASIDEASREGLLQAAAHYARVSLAGLSLALPGPTGETNTLGFHPRGVVLGLADREEGWLHQLAAVLATGNRLLLPASEATEAWRHSLPERLQERVSVDPQALVARSAATLLDLPEAARWRDMLARREGAILPCLEPVPRYPIEWLVVERCVTINTAATGGNTALMGLSDGC
ncbi:bifunctional proline dehydrogenase/L-glutamate gamma-semialdehyde dehydrogenase PutA [Zoogloea sp.]|uniref:bifunctional proline dehydrogenase/L-glutamate gamma-semialdehyde dehydrogenase PutA n=1 Tax=Zoogloea sp. TaxID=49181 RepID=UPI001416D15A|nr:MAG: bifunctional proline dehydrogenase/L-glutamate gamma-semialdehyde dehydrogenase PutA [Zoogloea sp.]